MDSIVRPARAQIVFKGQMQQERMCILDCTQEDVHGVVDYSLSIGVHRVVKVIDRSFD